MKTHRHSDTFLFCRSKKNSCGSIFNFRPCNLNFQARSFADLRSRIFHRLRRLSVRGNAGLCCHAKWTLMLLLLFFHNALQAQRVQPFKGVYENKTHQVVLHLDLDEESLDIPGMEFLGKTHGYLDGPGIYGVWIMVSHKASGEKARLRFTNDRGSDSQNIDVTLVNDSTLRYQARGTNEVRRAQGRKLVKIPAEMELVRRKDTPEAK